MTQEELDALMNGDMDEIATEEFEVDEGQFEFEEEAPQTNTSAKYEGTPVGYSEETAHH